ncbi:MAG: Xaa-Pro peptidase family protein [Candidatus Methanomethylicia archaeon]|nr:Xaa-Pro peptidase family protein [Candidatus Methanomethylicia archaeon]
MRHELRLEAFREEIRKNGLEYAIVTKPENVFYLTGAPFAMGSGGKVLFFRAEGEVELVVSPLDYEETAAKGIPKGVAIEMVAFGESPLEAVIKRFRGCEKVGIEDGFLTVSIYERMKGSAHLAPIGGCIERMREVKDDLEIGLIRKAQEIADTAFQKTLAELKEGMSEFEAASVLEYYLRRGGAEGFAFETIVASGQRAVFPHGMPSARRARGGEAVVFDFGVRVGGYCSDMTRTVFFGTPKVEAIDVYCAVLRAQESALAVAKAGISGRDLDRTARAEIESAGYGERFVHGLGHGVGLAVHEGPIAGPKNEKGLMQGNVITVEPGVYIPGAFGVRIEDLVVIRENGIENLTASPKGLTVV